ncbi:MAG: hypothetical protein CFE21_03600 [Bacteroidetes bacterium B1(2017)]|nr:MAG: hypothetical protein CFE21_03600 [Bacteroidetes bacterium B1(2017)]
MKKQHLIFIFTTIYLFCFNNLFSQESIRGIYLGIWPKKKISAYVSADSTYVKWKAKSTGEKVLNVLSGKIVFGELEYTLQFLVYKQPTSLLLCSLKDTIELIKVIEKTSNNIITSEIVTKTTYVDNGQPAKFTVFYYDTNQVKAYPWHPTSMAQFVNDRDKNNFYLKQGFEYLFYPYNSNTALFIQEKRKWKRGRLIKTKIYSSLTKEKKFIDWYQHY